MQAPPAATANDRNARLREVREQALEDPVVRELKDRIKSARSDEEQQRAWREYRATLRDKMHAIDPSLGDLIDQNEAAAPAR
jgi:DNA repair exonuclease SbcCD ATPase subunit